jgi:hypothetical protein
MVDALADLVVQDVQRIADDVIFRLRRRGRAQRLQLGDEFGARLVVLERGDQRLQVGVGRARDGPAVAVCSTGGTAGTWARAGPAAMTASRTAAATCRRGPVPTVLSRPPPRRA